MSKSNVVKITEDNIVVSIRLTRRELQDLAVACIVCCDKVNEPDNKWYKLHAKIKRYLALQNYK